MIVFDAFLNGKRLCRAGVGDIGMLYASVAWARAGRRGALSQKEAMLALNVEGRTAESYRVWQRVKLKPGDQVRLKVLEGNSADTPAHETPFDPTAAGNAERELYLRLKRKYGNSGPKRSKRR